MAESTTQSNASITAQTNQPPTNQVDQKANAPVESDPTAKFRGGGTSFRAKLIGIDDVPESRGDKMCQDSIIKLKENVKVSGQHKQKIVINISMSGIKLIDLMTAEPLHQHPVDRISFIARDMSDRRAFGYIYGDLEGKHHFFAIKTAKVAEQVVLVLRDLFQVVFTLKKSENGTPNEQNDANQAAETGPGGNLPSLDRQTSNATDATSPVTPAPSNEGDMFGMANLSDISSLSSDFSVASIKNDSSAPKKSTKRPFRRSSSQKSAASWNGPTTTASAFPPKRYASLSIGRAKELKLSLPEYNPSREPISASLSAKLDSATAQEAKDEQESSSDAKSLSSTPTTVPSLGNSPYHVPAQTPAHDGSSFFDEVMAATGIASDPAEQASGDTTQSTVKEAESVNGAASGSLSSVSSGSSKTSSSHKSLSFTNLFFSQKSDKKSKTSLKRKDKRSRQSSVSSVVSATDKNVPSASDTIRESAFTNSSENITSSATSRQRKPSTTSSMSVEPASDNLSRGRASSQTSEEGRARTVRVRPSAAVARARPRAALQQTSRGDSKNPPMFKASTVTNAVSPDDDKTIASRLGGSPASSRSVKSCSAEENEASKPDSAVSPGGERKVSEKDSWAVFGSKPDENWEGSEPQASITASPWASFPDGDGEKSQVPVEQADAWNAFDGDNEAVNRGKSDSPSSKDPKGFESSPFGDDRFDQSFADFDTKVSPARDGLWIVAEESSDREPAEPKSDDAFPRDPFSNDADLSLGQAEFLSCDPFGEIADNPATEDPFKDVEAVFDFQADDTEEEEERVEMLSDRGAASSEDPFRKDEAVKSRSNDVGERVDGSSELNQSTAETPFMEQGAPDPFENINFETAFATDFEFKEKTNDDEVNAFEQSSVLIGQNVPTDSVQSSPVCSHSSSSRSSGSPKRSDSSSPHPSSPIANSSFTSTSNHLSSTFDNPLANNRLNDDEFALPFNPPVIPSSSPPPLPPRRVKPVTPTEENASFHIAPPSPPPQPYVTIPPPPSSVSSPPPSVPPPFPSITIPPPPSVKTLPPPSLPPPPLPSRLLPEVAIERSSSPETIDPHYSFPPSFAPPKLPQRPLPPNKPPSDDFDFFDFGSNSAAVDGSVVSIKPPSSPPKTPPPGPLSHGDTFETSFQAPKVPDRSHVTAKSVVAGSEGNCSHKQDIAGNPAGLPRNSSYSEELSGFDMEALQPAASGGAKLTKDQILAGFGQGAPASGMYQQQAPNPYMPPQPVPGFGMPPQAPLSVPPAGVPFGVTPQVAMGGMFPAGPRPAVPARSGAMRPSLTTPTSPSPLQNPFGDAATPPSNVLAPVNLQPEPSVPSTQEEKSRPDPFASLLPSMGGTSGSKKDMFKNYTMAKPAAMSNGADQQAPPSGTNQDPFASNGVAFATTGSSMGADPFGVPNMNDDTFAFKPQEQANNMDSLFG